MTENTKTVSAPDLFEGGVYLQFYTGGIYFGINDQYGLSFGLTNQTSAGVAAYNSVGITISPSQGLQFTSNVGVGLAVPTGAPTGITGGTFYNFQDQTLTAQIGVAPLTDFFEAGVYTIGKLTPTDIPSDPQVPVGSVSSARLPGQFGTIRAVDAMNMLDVLGELAIERGSPSYSFPTPSSPTPASPTSISPTPVSPAPTDVAPPVASPISWTPGPIPIAPQPVLPPPPAPPSIQNPMPSQGLGSSPSRSIGSGREWFSYSNSDWGRGTGNGGRGSENTGYGDGRSSNGGRANSGGGQNAGSRGSGGSGRGGRNGVGGGTAGGSKSSGGFGGWNGPDEGSRADAATGMGWGGGGSQSSGGGRDRGDNTREGGRHGHGPGRGGYNDGYAGVPILLDIAGTGLNVDPLSSSSHFVDLNGDGKKHRTAWAGKGTGVLIYDADGNGLISNEGEFAFTRWAPSAASDLEALRTVFDTNLDGKLDASDAQWSKFKVVVDGQTKTLDELGIVSIDLTAKGSGQNFTDGSSITGTTQFTRSDGTTGAVGDAVLTVDPNGYVIKFTSATAQDGTFTREVRGYTEDGRLAFVEVTATSADGNSKRTQYDDDGNGTFDRSQTDAMVIDADGARRRTISNFNADGSVLSRTTNLRSADGKTLITQVDQNGDGTIDQDETVVSKADGSSQTTTTAYGPNGTVIKQVRVTASADGLSKTTETDLDGDGVFERSEIEKVTIRADGSRETWTWSKGANGVIFGTTQVINGAYDHSINVQRDYVQYDYNGDGRFEESETTLTGVDADGTVTTTVLRKDETTHKLLDKTITVRSSDGLSQTISTDWDGDGVIDGIASEVTTVGTDGARIKTVEQRSGNGTLLSRLTRRTSADGKTITVEKDGDGDGSVDEREVNVVNADGSTTRTVTSLASNGKLISQSVSRVSADGLSTTTSTDVNGDGQFDRMIKETKVTNADGSTTRTVSSFSGDNKLIGKLITTTSADSLTQRVEEDVTGDGVIDLVIDDVIVLHEDGRREETVTSRSASGVLLGKTVTVVSADRKTTTRATDLDGDGRVDVTETSVLNTDGSKTTTSVKTNAAGTVLGRTVETISNDGLVITRSEDQNGDGTIDNTTVIETRLNPNGSRTTIVTTTPGADSSAVPVSIVTTTTSANGQTTATKTELPGSGGGSTRTENRLINGDGTITTLVNEYAGTGTSMKLKYREMTTSSTTKSVTYVDDDGDGKTNWWATTTKSIAADGSLLEKTVVSTDAVPVLSSSTKTTSADRRAVKIEEDRDGNGSVDWRSVTNTNADGSVTQTVSTYGNPGQKSTSVTQTSADGLSVVTKDDIDGDGKFDRVTSDVTVIEVTGKRVRTITEKDASGALVSSSSTTISADGLTKSTSWSGKNGVKLGSSSDVTIVHADGSISQEISCFKADGSLQSRSIKTVSGDGRKATTTVDLDGDGKVNQRQLVVTNLDGSVTSTLTEYAADGATPVAIKTNTKSSDGLTETTEYNTNGTGAIEEKIVRRTILNADGSRAQITETFKATGEGSLKLQSRSTVSSSREGLAVEAVWEDVLNSAKYRQTDVTVMNADGSQTRTTSFFNGTILLSRKEVTTDATGLSIRTRLDPTGAGKFQETTDITTLKGDGTRTREVRSLDVDGSLLSSLRTDESADGTSAVTWETRTGFEARVYSRHTDTLADGTIVETLATSDDLQKLLSKTVTTTRADKREVTISRDVNGDGRTDQVEHRRIEVDGSVVTTISGFGSDGKLAERSIETVSSDGLTTTTQWDVDGDGKIDRQRTVVRTYNADGSEHMEATDKDAAGKLTQKTVADISADGQTRTTKTDVNGDGVFDQTETAVINVSGNRVATVTNAAAARASSRLAAGAVSWSKAIAVRVETTTSADGLTVTVRSDYDNNGTFEHVAVSKTRVDGSVFTTITETNADGSVKAKGTVVQSADGRTTILNKDSNNDGKIDRTETSVIRDDGSVILTIGDRAADGTISQTTIDTVTASGRLVHRQVNDSKGNKISETIFAADKITTFAANGQILSVTNLDANGVTTSAVLYDPLNANSWSRIEQSYTAGKKTSEKQFKDDGTRAEITFNATTGKTSQVSNYAATGQLLSKIQYDANGVTTSAVLYDPLNANSWSRIEQSYTAGKKTSEKQFKDDGTRAEITFNTTTGKTSQVSNFAATGQLLNRIQYDANGITTSAIFYDPLNANSWSRIERSYTAGKRSSEKQFKDDGTRADVQYNTSTDKPSLVSNFAVGGQLVSKIQYDANGITTSAIFYDPLNANPWSRIERSYTAGKKTFERQFKDDGTRADIQFIADTGKTSLVNNFAADGHRVSKVQYDAINANSWSRIETLFDAQGRQTQNATFNDDGSHAVSYWDTVNAQPWSTLTQSFNAANQLIAQNQVKDDGSRENSQYDPANAQPWSIRSQTYNSANQLTAQVEVKDNGSREDIQYDTANSNSWSRISRISDGSGHVTKETVFWDNSTRREVTYDSAGQVTSNKTFNAQNDQIGVNDIIDTDIAGDPYLIDGYRRASSGIYWVKDLRKYDSSSPVFRILATKYSLRMQYRAAHGITPVALDLNRDGQIDVQPLDWSTPNSNSGFDWNGDGVPDEAASIGPNDGLLVIDLDANGQSGPDGKIDQAKEIAFTLWKTEDERQAELQEKGIDDTGQPISDLEGLRYAFDTNGDRILDINDARWNEFRVWQDKNQNGVSEAGELLTTSEAGIQLIELMPSSEGAKSFADGSVITGTSSSQMTDGTKMLVGDVILAYRSSAAS